MHNQQLGVLPLCRPVRNVGISVKGNSGSQTGDLVKVVNSGDSVLFKVEDDGKTTAQGVTSTGAVTITGALTATGTATTAGITSTAAVTITGALTASTTLTSAGITSTAVSTGMTRA